jgi:ATP-dependent RNA helicase DHX37/DHR1
VLKIHQKLPKGGILVFLTGKQEIVRTVKKLRKRLKVNAENNPKSGQKDLTVADAGVDVDGLRDLDDDDIDGDIFNSNADGDIDDSDDDDDDDDETVVPDDGDTDGIPKKAIVLPLYSMLSVEEQAMVFTSVPEGYRLIVVTTNIAETSLTIPGISYVVDSGRQKSTELSREHGSSFLRHYVDQQSSRRSTSWSRGTNWSRSLLPTLFKQLVCSAHGRLCTTRGFDPATGRCRSLP